jgi:hypothetical protein
LLCESETVTLTGSLASGSHSLAAIGEWPSWHIFQSPGRFRAATKGSGLIGLAGFFILMTNRRRVISYRIPLIEISGQVPIELLRTNMWWVWRSGFDSESRSDPELPAERPLRDFFFVDSRHTGTLDRLVLKAWRYACHPWNILRKKNTEVDITRAQSVVWPRDAEGETVVLTVSLAHGSPSARAVSDWRAWHIL